MKRMAKNSKIEQWDRYYRSLSEEYLFPNEFVVRTFLGKYPNHRFEGDFFGKNVCDISCGDGRNLTLLHKLGFNLYATEVTEEICDITRKKLAGHPDRIAVDIRPGFNWELPFEGGFFDYLLSWNALYYMRDEQAGIADHVDEFARILKPGGYLVASVPSPGCHSLAGAQELGDNLIAINTSPNWSYLNGSIYHRFANTDAIKEVFGSRFADFRFATLKDDCFGTALEYFVFVCRKT
jgi:SAM-dependent methyltransferase